MYPRVIEHLSNAIDRCAFCIHPTSGELFAVDCYGRLLLFIESSDEKHKRSRDRSVHLPIH
jgi:hypothetical protein